MEVSGGGESFLQRGFEHGEMPHFASGSSFAFAVKMQLGIWLGENGQKIGWDAFIPKIAKEVDHDDG